MRSLTVEAISRESAQRLYDALSEFSPQLTGSEDEGYRVSIELAKGDDQIIAVLSVLEKHVIERSSSSRRGEWTSLHHAR